MFKFIHIPVQSGSDSVLKEMGRQYTVSEFKNVTSKFRKVIPDIALSTDVIIGFPTESDEDYKKTADLVKEVKPDVLNISKFRKRPNTIAAKHKSLATEIVAQRSKHMTGVFDWVALDVNRKWRHWEGGILIDEIGKENTWVGRNAYYKPVVIDKGNYKIGDKVKVKISGTSKYYLRA